MAWRQNAFARRLQATVTDTVADGHCGWWWISDSDVHRLLSAAQQQKPGCGMHQKSRRRAVELGETNLPVLRHILLIQGNKEAKL